MGHRRLTGEVDTVKPAGFVEETGVRKSAVDLDHPTDAIGGTVDRVEVGCPPLEVFQISSQHLEIPDPLINLVDPRVNELRDMPAGRLAAVSDLEDLA